MRLFIEQTTQVMFKDIISREEEIAVVEEKIEKKVEEKIETIREEVAGNFSLMLQRVEDLEKKLIDSRECDERKQVCLCCSSTYVFFYSASNCITSVS
ncbi:hypothetical protein TNCV_3609541 [Trichonephila clavipes]|nr:hypothetical protein TNCV_3609541 [Trichonephila clavipes]